MHHERSKHVLNIPIDKGEGKDTVLDRVRTKGQFEHSDEWSINELLRRNF